ncbi:hypothetical protein KP509_15G012100 [Ceratopteris richardii]|uniref:TIR domain-containing protein n=1 Tax=Ceratopteris richardii TaxID=49495 RepID=A0A8T2T126_CERRI|nr:hypothetical protein KP509_15G012100 [Ceratopteris richardii]
MSTDYNVFICHRGPETKRNVVSVLKGMLNSEGITCFVDFGMDKGTDANSAIEKAIESSLVDIVIVSADFRSSHWCLKEVHKIMKKQNTTSTPRKVIPVYYDVEPSMDMNMATLKWSTDDETKRWIEALKALQKLEGFEYKTETAFEWEELSNIVSEVKAFLISHDIIPSNRDDAESTWKMDMNPYYGSVFLCHNKMDTQRNAVSVFRGILGSRGITCKVVDYEKERDEMKLDVEKAIRNSTVQVIFLSENFVKCKDCLEEVDKIMVYSTKRPFEVKILPVFYNVPPSDVRHQKKGSAYDFINVKRGTDEERKRWSEALYRLSHLMGFEYNTEKMFQWQTLDEIARNVEAFLNKQAISYNSKQKRENLYQEELDEVSKMIISEDFNSKDVFFVGVYERNEPTFAELIVQEFRSQFDTFCFISDVEGSDPDRLVRTLYSDLSRRANQEPLSLSEVIKYRSHYEQLLRNKRCLVVFNKLGNHIDNLKPSLDLVKANLRHRSLVIFASRFRHVLKKEVKLDKFISLSSSFEDNRGFLTICYGREGDIHEAFFDQLQETFSMLGLDVHLMSKETLSKDSTRPKNSLVILCIISQGLSISEFEGMLANAVTHRPKVLYVSYGLPSKESTSKPCFELNVNFEESELDKAEYKALVHEVMWNLNKGAKEIMEVTTFPVGLKGRVDETWKEMSRFLSGSNERVQCFGFLGMGGVGKTTAAMSVYNKIENQFEAAYLCLNTRARGATGFEPLQREILQSLLSQNAAKNAAHGSSMDPTNDEVHGNVLFSSGLKGINPVARLEPIINEVRGNALLSSRPRGINALVVLDDVDSVAQLEALYAPLCASLVSNSVVIITSRDRHILEHAQPRHIFNIEELDEESSRRLFNWHAFLKPEAPAHLKEVSESVISACRGLPLALKVMGARLYRESEKECWDESFRFLRQNEGEIFGVLKKSLEGLESAQRDSFLDTACFFVGSTDVICRAYIEGVYGVGRAHLKVLHSRCLLTFEKEVGNCDTKQRSIGMHDHLRDMGRQVVRQKEKNRAWDEETAKDFLKSESTRSALCGLLIDSAMALPYEATKCGSLPELKFLRVVGDSQDGESLQGEKLARNVLRNVRCEELSLLDWRNAPFQEVPPGLAASTNLRVLDLRDSRIAQLPAFTNLRYVDMAGTNISQVPHEIFSDNLEYMDLSRTKIKELPSAALCPNLRRLYLFDTQISQVPHGLYSTLLEILEISGTNISEVQEVSLPNLLELDMRGCKGLKRLPSAFGDSMSSLQHLDLNECDQLEALDSGIGKLAHLRKLLLAKCHRLTRLPKELTELSSLEHLDLHECSSLESLSVLPTTLRKLYLNGCSSLQTVNAPLPKLQIFGAQGCPNLTTLPTELGACMRELWLMRCDGLLEWLATNQAALFPKLSSLEHLDLQGCSSLEALSVLPTTLQNLVLNGCSSLQTVSASLPKLQIFGAQGCPNLRTLPTDLGACIRVLSLMGCDGLSEWLATNQAALFPKLSSLEHLDLRECSSLEALSVLPTTLQELYLNGCSSLHTVSASLPKLQIFGAEGCPNLRTLPTELGTCMRELWLMRCDGLSEWLATNQAALFPKLSSLENLNLVECSSLEALSVLPTTLQKLRLNGCSSLQTVNASLPKLQIFNAQGCPNLRTLPTELGACMRELLLMGCDGLSEWLATNQAALFPKLPSLELLDFQECSSLEALSVLPTTLQKLWLNGCSSLRTVNASLPKLQIFNAQGCPNLRTLPTELGACMRELLLMGCDGLSEWLATNQAALFPKLSSLEILDLRECTSLEALSVLPTTLQKLLLRSCTSLQTVNASLPNLQEFYAQRCPNLRTLPTELGACMRELALTGCDGLSEWLATNQTALFPKLSSLEHLDLHECSSLESLSVLPTTLRKLYLNGCSSLQTVNAPLPKLQIFGAQGCPNLTTLPTELGACMRELWLMRCDGLLEWLATNQAALFPKLSSLEHLDLQGCSSLEALSVLPTTLQNLVLNGCSSLQTVSASLPKLQIFGAQGCPNLRTLPTDLGACIRVLSLMGCDGLSEWLATNQAALFPKLSSLEHLDLRECSSLEALSVLPTTLQELYLNGCSSLHTVSASLPKLQIFGAEGCPNLRTLPTELGTCMRELWLMRCDGLSEWLATNQAALFPKLSSLENLNLVECSSLEALSVLPTTLQKLRLNGCSSLQTVNASLPKLQIFNAQGCPNLRTLPTELGACMRELLLMGCDGLSEWLATNQAALFPKLSSLEHLDLVECSSLEALSVLPTTLQKLRLNGCSSLQTVNASLPKLQIFNAQGCPNLRTLPTELGACMRELLLMGCDGLSEWLATNQAALFPKLSSLELLDLQKCTSLETLSVLPTTLQKLVLSCCTSLQTVNASLPKLEEFYAPGCPNLRTLPTELGACMRKLWLEGCDGLSEWLATNQAALFPKLSSLELLDLQKCTSLETLSVLPTTLQKLGLNSCSRLQTVNASLPKLEKFYAPGCPNLRTLPTELGACMRELSLVGCDGLSEWLATNQAALFPKLSSLELLDLQKCTSLETLSVLPTTLQKLGLNSCSRLQTVNASLPKLEKFYAPGCPNLRTLPTELGACMRELSLVGCDGLSEWLATNQAALFPKLSSLELLDLQKCTSLETLSVLPTTLQKLGLNSCSRLQTVNASLPKLEEFYAPGCPNLRTLPTELGACMRELSLEGCDGLSEWLATNQAALFPKLSSLELLNLQQCTSLQALSVLPTTLQTLRLNGCSSLQTVNGSLPKLQEFSAQGCPNLRTLPTELGACMRELWLMGCDGLSEWLATNQAALFPKLSSLELLNLQQCTSLQALSVLPTTLQTLRLNGCSSLQTVNGSLPKLQEFSAQGCPNLRTLPTELGACMRELWLMGCDGLSEWLATNQAALFPKLSSLEILDLRECTSLEALSVLPTTLQKLALNSCSRLQTVNASLPKLQEFHAAGCRYLRALPTELGACMRELHLKGCDGLSQWLVTNQAALFPQLSSLELLDLQGCSSLESLSVLPTTLRELNLYGCSRLQTVNASLPKLEKLYVLGCPNLRTLPTELGACMRELALGGCDGLSEWLATNQAALFPNLYSLEKLDLSSCMSLKTLSFLPTSLEVLFLFGCRELEVLDLGSGNLTNLKHLDISCCPRLRSLPQELETLPALSITRDEPAMERHDSAHTIDRRRGLRSRIKSWVRRKCYVM